MQIDYLFGRKVESVEEGGADNAAWFLVLEGGAKIVVFDDGYAVPDAEPLVGLSLNASDTYQGQVRLFFGTADNPNGTVVHLPPGQYGISDDTYTQGEVIDPEAEPAVQDIPPDPEELRRAEAAEAPEDISEQIRDDND